MGRIGTELPPDSGCSTQQSPSRIVQQLQPHTPQDSNSRGVKGAGQMGFPGSNKPACQQHQHGEIDGKSETRITKFLKLVDKDGKEIRFRCEGVPASWTDEELKKLSSLEGRDQEIDNPKVRACCDLNLRTVFVFLIVPSFSVSYLFLSSVKLLKRVLQGITKK